MMKFEETAEVGGVRDECRHGTRLTLRCHQCDDEKREREKRATVITADDKINHPAHYMACGLESITVIEAFSLSFSLGNVCKYVLRCDRKGEGLEDLKKARWYLEREIARRERP